MSDEETVSSPPSRRAALIEIATVFTRLGFTAFGGPMAHVALMEDELVNRRKWCDRQHFLDMLGAVNFIPGPNSTELAIHLGYLRGGTAGLFIAGFCFITPAVLIILPIAFLYVRYHTLPGAAPILHTISATILAIIAVAATRLAINALRSVLTIVVAAITLTILLLSAAGVRPIAQAMKIVQPEIVLLAIAAGFGMLWSLKSFKQRRTLTSLALLPLTEGLPAPMQSLVDSNWVRMIWFFFKVGATLFGSGYVLASFLQTGLVEHLKWISPSELSDGIAVGQFTPGPLLTTATFFGYLLGYRNFGGGDSGGVAGAILATGAIFLPSFLLILILAPILNRLRRSPIARGALDGMNAAVVVLIAATILRMSSTALTLPGPKADLVNIAIALASCALLLLFNLNATWLVLGAIAIGFLRVWAGV
jgi:chromate transporter